MCSIAGLFDKGGSNVGDALVQMLKQTSHRGPDGCGVYINGDLRKADDIQELRVEGMEGAAGLGHSRLQITGSVGVQPLWGCQKRFILGFNGEIWNHDELRDKLTSLGHIFETDSDGEVIVHLVEESYKKTQDLASCILDTDKKLDGEYAFAIFDNITKTMILTRDPVGVKQLYYGQDTTRIAFCSEKKPLWCVGITPQRVLPGEVVEMSFDTSSKKYAFKSTHNEMICPDVKIHDEEKALVAYQDALFNSVRKRIEKRDRVGIIFSGGVDSVVIAQIAKKSGCNITCYASGFKNSPDITAARHASKELGLDLKVHELSEEEIKNELENIVSSIESTNHLQVDVAIPIFFAVKEAKKDSIRVMLTGQGADEIFAGYEWYPKIFKDKGGDVLHENLWNDVKNLYKDTLEREDKIAMYHSIELRVPYLDPEVIGTAMSIAEELKIKDNHVKYIHRKLAEEIGVPHDLAWRKKEAAQHGSQVHNNLITIIEKIGKTVSDDIVITKGNENEVLGSAYRYNHNTYKENESVQRTLDHMGKKLGLYPQGEFKN